MQRYKRAEYNVHSLISCTSTQQ